MRKEVKQMKRKYQHPIPMFNGYIVTPKLPILAFVYIETKSPPDYIVPLSLNQTRCNDSGKKTYQLLQREYPWNVSVVEDQIQFASFGFRALRIQHYLGFMSGIGDHSVNEFRVFETAAS